MTTKWNLSGVLNTASAAATLPRHNIWFNGQISPVLVQVHDLQGLVGHGHAARGALLRVPALDVGVQQDGVVVGV